jgi:hypothetical protein
MEMTKPIESSFVERFVTALRDAGVTVDVQHSTDLFGQFGLRFRADALLRLNDQIWMAVEVTRSGYPRDIREAIWKLQSMGIGLQPPNTDMRIAILAEHLTDASRELLKSHGCAYFDTGGSLFLKAPSAGLLIDIDRPPPKLLQRRAHSVFTSAREQVLHALMHQGDAWSSGIDIAAASQTSPFTVSQTIAELEKLDWIESRNVGSSKLRRLNQPGQLLDAWATQWQSRKESVSRWYRWSASTEELLVQISQCENAKDVVLTGAAAANQLTPWLTQVDRIDLIVPPGTSETLAQQLELKSVTQGANIQLVERTGASRLFTEPSPITSTLHRASPYILYLDLLDGRGRNKELAQKLRTNIMKY